MSEGVFPVVTIPDTTSTSPGSNVNVTVNFNIATKDDQAVSISSSPGGFFSSIPSQVTLPTGQTSLSFQTTVSTNASGSGTITATCNGAHATSVPISVS